MISTWNIIRKDFVRFRIPFIAWTLLIGAKHVFFSLIAGVWGAPNFALLFRMQSGPGFFVSFAIEPLVAYFLVASLVYEDPPAGKDPFWVTRPISGRQLLAAKALTALGMFAAWPVLLSLPWWIECGSGPLEIAVIGGNLLIVYSTIVLTGLATAAVTDTYPRYILWTLTGLAVVVMGLTLPALLRDTGIFRSPESSLVHADVALLAIVLISLVIIRHQFCVRYFRHSLVIAVAGTLLVLALVFSSPLTRIAGYFEHADQPRPQDAKIRLSVAGPLEVGRMGRTGAEVLKVPIKFEGLPESAIAYVRLTGTWTSADSKVWTAQGAKSATHLDARSARYLARLAPIDPPPSIETVQFAFPPTRPFARRIADAAISFRGTATFTLSEGKLLAELPIREQATRIDGGSISIEHLERHDNLLSFGFTARIPVNLTGRVYWVGSFNLVNHRTGEIVRPELSTRQSRGNALINLVQVATMRAAFKIPSSPGWLDDATLAINGFEPGRKVVVEFESPLTPPAAATSTPGK